MNYNNINKCVATERNRDLFAGGEIISWILNFKSILKENKPTTCACFHFTIRTNENLRYVNTALMLPILTNLFAANYLI